MFEYQLFQPSFPSACAFDYFLLERESRTHGLGNIVYTLPLIVHIIMWIMKYQEWTDRLTASCHDVVSMEKGKRIPKHQKIINASYNTEMVELRVKLKHLTNVNSGSNLYYWPFRIKCSSMNDFFSEANTRQIWVIIVYPTSYITGKYSSHRS